MRSPLAMVLSVPVWIYRLVISPMKPATCRFRPTCSGYALEALAVHGALRGSWLTIRRLCRCHPFCEPGYDPVPNRRQSDRRQRVSSAASATERESDASPAEPASKQPD